jgi:hypothetical protein
MNDTMSLHQFSKVYNLSKSTLHRRAKELGIDTANGLSPDAQRQLKVAFQIPSQPLNSSGEAAEQPIAAEVVSHIDFPITTAAPFSTQERSSMLSRLGLGQPAPEVHIHIHLNQAAAEMQRRNQSIELTNQETQQMVAFDDQITHAVLQQVTNKSAQLANQVDANLENFAQGLELAGKAEIAKRFGLSLE